MKIKSTVLLVAAALALSACTKSENTDAAAADAAAAADQAAAAAGDAATAAGDAAAAAGDAAAAAAAAAAASSQVAYGGTLDGGEIYKNLCGACHTNGVGKAPMLTAAGMGARASKGVDTLYKHAIEGFTGPDGGIMPPKGGNPAISEEQIHATVDWMLANSK